MTPDNLFSDKIYAMSSPYIVCVKTLRFLDPPIVALSQNCRDSPALWLYCLTFVQHNFVSEMWDENLRSHIFEKVQETFAEICSSSQLQLKLFRFAEFDHLAGVYYTNPSQKSTLRNNMQNMGPQAQVIVTIIISACCLMEFSTFMDICCAVDKHTRMAFHDFKNALYCLKQIFI